MRRLALLLLVVLAGSASGEKWRFVVAGDGRADPPRHRPEDVNGINKLITSEMCQAVIDEKAKFLMWTGDLVIGYAKDPETFKSELLTWRQIMQPLYDRRIPVLPCRGNHDAGSAEAWKMWSQVFTGPYALPQNGPPSEKDLTFYYKKGPVLAIGLDQYTEKGESVDEPWLEKVLRENPSPFVFAMGHEPAFMDGFHKDTMDASPERRDAFWETLIKSGARVFFCGHDHLYDHMVVTRDGPNPGPEMHQFVAGTAGAPFYTAGDYTGNNTSWKLNRVKHIERTYGYMVVEIDGNKATITFKGRTSPGHYEAMDSFSYTVGKKERRK